MEWWPAYLALGATAGFLAGLFGVGGGMVMVPALVLIFGAKGFPPDYLMHFALATGLATILFTSVASVYAHDRHGAVDWRTALSLAPGAGAGAVLAALGAGLAPTRALAIFFAAFLFYAAGQGLFGGAPKASRRLPGRTGLFAAGTVIGSLAAALAAGGAFLSIPFLVWCNVPLKRAIGTAAAVGFPIAAAGTVGYVIQGQRAVALPEGSLGFVYLPALALLIAASMPAAPFGARLAHRLPARPLRVAYALMLAALGVRMLAVVWGI